jgi:hypothetical protein
LWETAIRAKFAQVYLKKEEKMSKQMKLFEEESSVWVLRVLNSIQAPHRQEIIGTLARMGKAALQVERRGKPKGGKDES